MMFYTQNNLKVKRQVFLSFIHISTELSTVLCITALNMVYPKDTSLERRFCAG